MNASTSAPLDLAWVRSRFPSLDTDWALFDNGGGSQILQPVLDRIVDYLVTSNVQLGASYELSRLAGDRLREAQAAMATLVNARDPSEIVMGGSTTVLLRTLATAFADHLTPGDHVIVTDCDHEANIAPWLELERVGVEVSFWHVDAESLELRLDDLEALMTPRTKLVAVTHTSNILGTINPVRAIADIVHAGGALLCVDGVGFAPHRAVDVQELDADFYAFSFYKTFGPHHALLWGRQELLRELPSRSFAFIDEDDVPYKFQPGNVNYELSYGLLGLTDYLTEMARGGGGESGTASGSSAGADGVGSRGGVRRDDVEVAFDRMAAHEEVLVSRLLVYLRGRPEVRIVGFDEPDAARRVAIVSFTVMGIRSADVVRSVDEHRVAIRYGHFYSARLIERLGLAADDGVVRVSMVHYNTLDEVDRLITALEGALG